MTTRRPALIFDFGNVVAFFDYTRACHKFGSRIGLTGEAFLARAREGGLTPLVQQYERGAMGSEEFARSVGSLVGLEITHDDFAPAWSDIFWINEPVAALVRGLKSKGYILVLGSNTNDLHATQFRRQFVGPLSHFDRLVLSYEIGHIKPSAEFYLACARAADTAPADCIFIDDMAENVEGARAAGLTAVQYRDVPTLCHDLRTLGVEVPDRIDELPA